MKKLLLLMGLFLLSQTTFSQNLLVEKNKIWKYEEDCFSCCGIKDKNALKTGSDTIINGKTYFPIFSCSGGDSWYPTRSFLRQEDSVVYELYDNDETILYDFRLKEGDSIFAGESDYIYVDSIVKVSGIRYFYLSNRVGKTVWIENVGSLDYLLIPLWNYTVVDVSETLICCERESDLLYLNPNFEDCPTVIASNGNYIVGGQKLWKYTHRTDTQEGIKINDYALSMGPDTIIEKKRYKSFWKSTNLWSWEKTEYFLRQKDSVVYIYNLNNQKDTILYDFRLKVGDSIYAKHINSYLYLDSINNIKYHYSGETRCFYFSGRGSNTVFQTIWIERLGCINGMFESSGNVGSPKGQDELLCCTLCPDMLYQNPKYGRCDLISIDPVTINIDKRIVQNYPNPFKESTTIEVLKSGNEKVYLNIYSIEGRLIKSIKVTENGINKIEVKNIGAGLFFYTVSINGRLYGNSKKMICIE